MTLLRRLIWVVLAIVVVYSVLWLAGMVVINIALNRIKPEPRSALEDLLAEEISGGDAMTFDFESHAVRGYPLGYTIELERPSLDHTLVAWQAEDPLVTRWSWLRPFSVEIDYSGTHQVAAVTQPPVQLSADRAVATVQVEPLFEARTARLALVETSGESAGLVLRDRPIASVERFAFGLDVRAETAPGDILLDIFGFALSDDAEVQARYRSLLEQLGNAESTLSALGIGLDVPIDHVRMRANVRPFFPLAGSSIVLPSFISRGGNVLVEVLDVQQGNWRGRSSARAMFGPDARLMVQSCLLLRAGASFVPIPFANIVTLYIAGEQVDIQREPIPEIALPATVEPFTHRELCDVARLYQFADETSG